MVGFYILVRCLEIISTSASKSLQILAFVTIVVNIAGIFALIVKGAVPQTNLEFLLPR